MKQDIEYPEVTGVKVVIALDSAPGLEPEWGVYLLNENDHALVNVLISSVGYSFSDGTNQQRTSTLRHLIEYIEPQSYARIEPIDPAVFHLANEYWVSYYKDNFDTRIHDKKFIFMPDTVSMDHLVDIPMLEKKGVVHE